MGISVNGIELTDDAVQAELKHHQQAANPLKQSVHELILRTLLLQEADRLGIAGEDDDTRVEALLAQEVRVPAADAATCRTYYDNQPQLFASGEMVEARHILFQVTPKAPLDLVRDTAQAILEELQAKPQRFDEIARQYSNCPSAHVGGNLGQLSRGQTVPEFEDYLFRLDEGELGARLLETRFGLHIVQVMRKVPGNRLPFEAVQGEIADRLTRQSWQRGIHQYLQILAGKADIKGVTLEGAESPLVQ